MSQAVIPRITPPNAIDPRAIPGVALFLDATQSPSVLNAVGPDTPATYNQGVRRWADQSGNGNHADQSTAGNQPLYVRWDGLNFLRLPGASGNFGSVPHAAALSLGDTFCLLADVAMTDWTPAAISTPLSKWQASGGDFRSYQLQVRTDGTIGVVVSGDGTSANITVITSSADVTARVADGGRLAIRADYVGGGATARFYTAPTLAGPWTELGTEQSGTARTPFATASANLNIGASSAGTSTVVAGRYFGSRIINGTFAGGTVVFDDSVAGVTHAAASYVNTTGQTVTINSTGNDPATIVGHSMLRGDNTDDFLSFSGSGLDLFRNLSYATVIGCGRFTVAPTSVKPVYLWSVGGGTNSRVALFGGAVSGQYNATARLMDADSASSFNGGTAVIGTPFRFLHEVRFAAGNHQAYINNVSIGSAALSASGASQNTASDGARLFANTANNQFSGYDAAMLVIVQRLLTAREIRGIDLWMTQQLNGALG